MGREYERDDWCFMGYSALEVLENVSEAQVDEKVFPSIADLDVPLAIRRGNKVSWDLKRRGAVEEVPLQSEELKRSGALLCSRYKLRFSADKDAVETVVSRLERQLNRHCIRLDNIPETKTRREELLKPGSSAQSLALNRADRARRARAEVEQDHTSEAHRDEHWRYMLDLARAVVQELQDKPRAAETGASQTYDYVQFPVDIT